MLKRMLFCALLVGACSTRESELATEDSQADSAGPLVADRLVPRLRRAERALYTYQLLVAGRRNAITQDELHELHRLLLAPQAEWHALLPKVESGARVDLAELDGRELAIADYLISVVIEDTNMVRGYIGRISQPPIDETAHFALVYSVNELLRFEAGALWAEPMPGTMIAGDGMQLISEFLNADARKAQNALLQLLQGLSAPERHSLLAWLGISNRLGVWPAELHRLLPPTLL